jgi:hypothetical protein
MTPLVRFPLDHFCALRQETTTWPGSCQIVFHVTKPACLWTLAEAANSPTTPDVDLVLEDPPEVFVIIIWAADNHWGQQQDI